MNRIAGAGLGALLSFLLMVPVASAAPVPTLGPGTRGQDVLLVQKLLSSQGHQVPATGRYGTMTAAEVREFQAGHGLSRDGVVGPATYATLTPTLRPGSRGMAVEALQQALSAKHGYKVTVDGIFGPQTQAAVRAFQAHQGISVTGVVGDQTWSALLAHYQRLPGTGPGWYRYLTSNGDAAWGTANTIAVMKEVARNWKASGAPVRIGVGDISNSHGGFLPGHASHRRGVDVDLNLVRNDGLECPVTRFDRAYSRSLTQRLVNLLLATGEVELIFFNDPNVKGVMPWPNHDDHLHIRFRR